MELTGKASKDFEKYVTELEVAPYISMLDSIPKCYLYSLMVDFFDSVEIKIFIQEAFTYYFRCYFSYDNIPYWIHEKFNTRQEATKKAIEKANEIYNGNNL